MRMNRYTAALITAFTLIGCTAFVPTTAMQLSGLDPLSADPADFAVSLTLPDGINVESGSARLALSAQNDEGKTLGNVYVLRRTNDVFEIDPSDWENLRKLQADLLAWKDTTEDIDGSFGITLAPCKIGQGPSPDARVSVSVRMVQDGPFMPLVRNGPLSAVVSEEDLQGMATCP